MGMSYRCFVGNKSESDLLLCLLHLLIFILVQKFQLFTPAADSIQVSRHRVFLQETFFMLKSSVERVTRQGTVRHKEFEVCI